MSQFSCAEKIESDVEDIRKLEYLNPFVTGSVKDFHAVHDLDSGNLKFEYSTDDDGIIQKIDSIARSQSWIPIDIRDTTRVYKKNVRIYGDESLEVTVEMKYSHHQRQLNFNVN